MILSMCDSPDVLSAMSIVKTLITIIKIAVPIILIVIGMIEFVKGELAGDTGAPLRSLIKKSLAAIIIFLIPTVVNVLIKVTDVNIEYYGCIDNANDEYINVLYEKQAASLVETAKLRLGSGDYTAAKVAVERLKNESAKSSLKAQLVLIEKEMELIKNERELKRLQEDEAQYEKYKDLLERIKKQRQELGKTYNGLYSKEEIINMSEERVKSMSKKEFFDFIGSAAQLVYSEYGGVLPSITIAQASLESGYGKKFTETTHNPYGLVGYPAEKPKFYGLRKFDNFYEATYYHTQYFFHFTQYYSALLDYCDKNDPMNAASDLRKYGGGSIRNQYPDLIRSIINTYNLTSYDPK